MKRRILPLLLLVLLGGSTAAAAPDWFVVLERDTQLGFDAKGIDAFTVTGRTRDELEQGSQPAFAVYRVVSENGGLLAVENILGLDRHCVTGELALAGLRLHLFVHEQDLVPVVTGRTTVRYRDASKITIEPGTPTTGRDAPALVALDQVKVRAGAVGDRYSLAPAAGGKPLFQRTVRGQLNGAAITVVDGGEAGGGETTILRPPRFRVPSGTPVLLRAGNPVGELTADRWFDAADLVDHDGRRCWHHMFGTSEGKWLELCVDRTAVRDTTRK